MDLENPEDELEEFLSQQPSWLRKFLQGDYALSPEERSFFLQSNWPETYGQARDEYLRLLQRCPARLQEYRKREKKRAAESALLDIPSVPPGARRKDWIAQEASLLQQAGMNHSDIARELNKRHPDLRDRKGNLRPITSEVVRKHLASRRRRSGAEKI